MGQGEMGRPEQGTTAEDTGRSSSRSTKAPVRALVTGANGLLGSHLIDRLALDNAIDTHGTVRGSADTSNLSHIMSHIKLWHCDINDISSVLAVLQNVRPDVIFHFAAQSSGRVSFQAPLSTLRTNAMGTATLMEGLKILGMRPKVILASCGCVYDGLRCPKDGFKELRNAPNPDCYYGISKLMQEHIVRHFSEVTNTLAFELRIFKMIGPRQREQFPCSSLAAQMAKGERDLSKVAILRVRESGQIFDFVDARDAAEACIHVMRFAKTSGVYNVCSGHGYKVSNFIHYLVSYSARHDWRLVNQRERGIRDAGMLVGDYSELYNETGWRPRYDLESTAYDMLQYWRDKLWERSVTE